MPRVFSILCINYQRNRPCGFIYRLAGHAGLENRKSSGAMDVPFPGRCFCIKLYRFFYRAQSALFLCNAGACWNVNFALSCFIWLSLCPYFDCQRAICRRFVVCHGPAKFVGFYRFRFSCQDNSFNWHLHRSRGWIGPGTPRKSRGPPSFKNKDQIALRHYIFLYVRRFSRCVFVSLL